MPATHRKQVIAAVIGNALEWYDFVVFGFLTVIISRLFFPDDNELLALLKTTATFGVGFMVRYSNSASPWPRWVARWLAWP